MNLQDAFINQIRTQRQTVTVKLLTGEEIVGLVRGFDPVVVVMDVEDGQRIVYKHAISVITPHEPLDLFSNQERDDEEDR